LAAISAVTTNDTLGVPDSMGVTCILVGTVHGINMGGSSTQFVLYDATGAITVRKSGGFTPAYNVNEGDSIAVQGTIGQYNGLTQFNADTMTVIPMAGSVRTPMMVNKPSEMTESRLIRIDSVSIISGTWPSSGTSTNLTVVSTLNDTITLRIDRNGQVDDSVTAPVGMFDVIGYGGQFDSQSPYDEGYQILPQVKGHIIKHNSTPPPPPAAMPHYGLGVVTTEDASGVADSLNVACSVSGVVHGIDMSGLTSSSNTFTLMDATGTIAVYKSGGFTPAYTVNESDSISMYGKITQYNGLTQFSADSMKVHSTGAMTSMWTKVSMLDESTESQYIRIDSVTLVDASQWPAVGGQGNVDIETQAGDTLVIFIDRDSYVSDSAVAAPAGLFDVIGYGGQFDFSSPYTSGYSIIPQLQNHILPYAAAACNVPTMLDAKSITDVSADLEWMTGGSNTWNIEYGMTGFTQGTGTMMTVTSNPYMLTGLTANTSYEFYVQDSCVGLGTSAWSVSDTFMTAAGPVAIPTYNISDLRSTDANGVIDSIGVNCAIEGIVVTHNFSEAGASGPDVSFVIVDEMNMSGFTAISFDDTATINYAPHIGDSVKVYGTVGQFNGLGQFEIDSVVMYKAMVMVPMPYVTDTLSEMTESRFIEMRQVELADTSQWPAVGSDANVDVINQHGDTVTMRIDRHTDVAAMWPVAPLGKFNLLGVGGQYDGSSPYTSGYQVFPRIFMDIDTAAPAPCMDPTNLMVADMDVDTAVVSWTSSMGNSWNIKWGTSNTMASDSAMNVMTNPYVLSGLTKATTYYVWVQENCPGGMSSWVGPVDFMTLTSVEAIAGSTNSFVAYPNPNSTEKVNFNREINVTVRNMTGQIVKSADKVTSLDISELVDGMYLLISNDGEVVRLIVQ
ncbi:MAG: T9SS type A sorting domain-containing protein, partial [Salibacteraceae bacterium]